MASSLDLLPPTSLEMRAATPAKPKLSPFGDAPATIAPKAKVSPFGDPAADIGKSLDQRLAGVQPSSNIETADGKQMFKDGVLNNATAGLNELIYGTLGYPVDAVRNGINDAIIAANALTGQPLKQNTLSDKNTFMGADWWNGVFQKIGVNDPNKVIARDMADKIARLGGEGVGMTLAPELLFKGLSDAGLVKGQIAEVIKAIVGDGKSAGGMAKNATIGAGANVTGGLAAENAPDNLKPAVQLGASLVGGFGTGLGLEGAGLAGKGVRAAARSILAPLTEGGREGIVGRQLVSAAEDSAASQQAIRDYQPGVEGSQQTLAGVTGDKGLASLERDVATRNPTAFNERAGQQNDARVGAINDLQTTGSGEALVGKLNTHINELNTHLDNLVEAIAKVGEENVTKARQDAANGLSAAQQRARQAAQDVGVSVGPEETGAALRDRLIAARNVAKDAERKLWQAVDPEGRLRLTISDAKAKVAELFGARNAAEKPLEGEAAAIKRTFDGLSNDASLAEVQSLQSRIKEEIRAEKARSMGGETNTARLLGGINAALQEDLNTGVLRIADEQAKAVAAGAMREEDTLAARFQRQVDQWYADRSQAGTGVAGGADGVPGGGPPASAAVPGAAGENPTIAGRAGGDPGLPANDGTQALPEGGVDIGAQARLNAARQATRERVQTHDNADLRPVRKPDQSGGFAMPDANVPRKFFFPRPASAQAIERLRNAVGDEQALSTLEPYAIDQFRLRTETPDGTIDPRKAEIWMRNHREALDAFPALRQRIENAMDASRGVETESARGASAVKAAETEAKASNAEISKSTKETRKRAQEGAIDRVMHAQDHEEVVARVSRIMKSDNAAAEIGRLRRAAGSDKDAQEGLRKAVVDAMVKDFVGNTTIGNAEEGTIRSNAFLDFVRNKKGALKAAGFTDSEVKIIEAVAEDLKRTQRAVTAVKIPGQSNTTQDILAQLKGKRAIHTLLDFVLMPGLAGAETWGAHPILGLSSAAAGAAFGALRQRGLMKADKLLAEAMLNPDLALRLMERVTPKNAEQRVRGLIGSLSPSGIAGALRADEPRGPQYKANIPGEVKATVDKADVQELTDIVHKVSGLKNVETVDTIHLPGGAEEWGIKGPTTARGSYHPVEDVVTLAMDSADRGTAYHESFHRLQNRLLSIKERATLRAETDRLRQMVGEGAEKLSQSELEAEAFAVYATKPEAAKGLPAFIRSAWDKIAATVRRVGNFLQGRGYMTSEDVFAKAKSGEIANRAALPKGASTELQAKANDLVATPAFKRWFGESKMVDKSGAPRVFYHGTRRSFDAFRPNIRKGEQLGFGIHFSADPDFAGAYASDPTVARRGKDPRVEEVFLSIKNPLMADTMVKEGSPEFELAKKLAGSKLYTTKDENGTASAWLQNAIDSTSPERAERLIKEAGYDGVVYKSTLRGRSSFDTKMRSESVIVFAPEQIKSVYNRGTFDPKDARIQYQVKSRLEESGDHPDRISTRVPGLKSSSEDPLKENLVIGLDAMKANPAAFAHNMELVKTYPGVKITAKTPDKIAEQFIDHVRGNLRWLYEQTPKDIRERSKLWYDGARKIAERVGEKYGLHDYQVAGTLAALSPQKDWFQNVSLAERLIDIHEKFKADTKAVATPEMKSTADRIFAAPQYGEDLKTVLEKPYADLNLRQKAMWIRLRDEAHNPRGYHTISPEGDRVGKPSGNVAWGSLVEIAKAVKVLDGGTRDIASSEMGAKHKVRNFYNNILAPNAPHGDVTIDTHAVAAGLMRPLSGSSSEVMHNFGSSPMKEKAPADWRAAKTAGVSGAEGTYGIFAEAYRREAQALGILPRELQSITWEAVRGLFTPTFKRNKMSAQKIDNIWAQAKAGKITADEARAQISKVAGGIDAPDWHGHGRGVAEGAEAAPDAGKLEAVRSSGEPAGRMGGGDPAADAPADGRAEREAGLQRLLDQGRSGALRLFSRRGGGRAEEVRRPVKAVFFPSKEFRDGLQEIGLRAPIIHELEPAKGASHFHRAISKAKAASPYGAAVYVYKPKEYAGFRLFLDAAGTSGFAVKEDGDIVSVFSAGGGAVHSMLALAVQQGGKKLDCFDTVLPRIYAKNGFVETGRVPWDDQYKPPDWSYERFKKYNDGRPDVVFMEYRPSEK